MYRIEPMLIVKAKVFIQCDINFSKFMQRRESMKLQAVSSVSEWTTLRFPMPLTQEYCSYLVE